MSGIEKRKSEHLTVAASGDADFRERTTLFEEVHLVHQALPEMDVADIDLTTELFGQTLSAPIVITGMTGGTAEAEAINRDLAIAAEAEGVAMGLGSQRALAEKPELLSTYQVRQHAPNVVLIGNIGVIQAQQYGIDTVRSLAEAVGASAMALHLNPAQEMMQKHGDRGFAGALHTIATLRQGLDVPVVVKETGCGLSSKVAGMLKGAGVDTVDVAGAGGTSWVAVESHRAEELSREEFLSKEFWDWGLPTAVATQLCCREGLTVIASGGVRSGLDIAKALAMGARAGGAAAPFLRAQQRGGVDAICSLIRGWKESITTALLLTACRTPAELSRHTCHYGPNLRAWIRDVGA